MMSQKLQPFAGNISFNAQHSPMGAFMSFTCGNFGTRGGVGLQIGQPGNQDIYIGVKDGDRKSDSALRCLPFFQGNAHDAASRVSRRGRAGTTNRQGKGAGVPRGTDQALLWLGHRPVAGGRTGFFHLHAFRHHSRSKNRHAARICATRCCRRSRRG